MPDEGQFAELMRHVHAVTDDELVRAVKADKVAGDVGGKVPGLVQHDAAVGAFGATGHDQVLGEGQRAA